MASFCGFDSQELLPISLHPEITLNSNLKQLLRSSGWPCIIFTVAGFYLSRLLLNDEFDERVYLLSQCETYGASKSTSLKFKDSNDMSPALLTELAWKAQHEDLHGRFIKSQLEAVGKENQGYFIS